MAAKKLDTVYNIYVFYAHEWVQKKSVHTLAQAKKEAGLYAKGHNIKKAMVKKEEFVGFYDQEGKKVATDYKG